MDVFHCVVCLSVFSNKLRNRCLYTRSNYTLTAHKTTHSANSTDYTYAHKAFVFICESFCKLYFNIMGYLSA